MKGVSRLSWTSFEGRWLRQRGPYTVLCILGLIVVIELSGNCCNWIECVSDMHSCSGSTKPSSFISLSCEKTIEIFCFSHVAYLYISYTRILDINNSNLHLTTLTILTFLTTVIVVQKYSGSVFGTSPYATCFDPIAWRETPIYNVSSTRVISTNDYPIRGGHQGQFVFMKLSNPSEIFAMSDGRIRITVLYLLPIAPSTCVLSNT